MDSVRGIAYRLRPSQLDDLGLMASLRWHMDKVIRPTGVPYALVGNVDETRFPADIELCCFRVVQEALNNVMKHARATRIEVNLYRTENALALQVRDEGIGFDVSNGLLAPESIGSLGLIGMRERVAATGGQLQIHSMPGQGTEIDANFPLPPSRPFS
jgi:signal transduction histidine kinase